MNILFYRHRPLLTSRLNVMLIYALYNLWYKAYRINCSNTTQQLQITITLYMYLVSKIVHRNIVGRGQRLFRVYNFKMDYNCVYMLFT